MIGGIVATPAVLAAGRVTTAGVHAASFMRPHASGASSERCAQCGGTGHTMLDPACPAAPGVV